MMGSQELMDKIAGLTEPEAKELLFATRQHLASISRNDEASIPDNDWLVGEAKKKYAGPSDDDIEVDDDAIVSHGEGGAFVEAWVWVPYPESHDEIMED